jgi:uncharacterized protein YqeY
MLEQIERDIKAALLAGEKDKVEVLKGLKTAVQYEAVSQRLKSEDLNDEQIQKVMAREAKKRQDTAEIYKSAGELERADKELQERAVIAHYLPAQLDDAKVAEIVDEELAKLDSPTIKDMGRVVGLVRARTASQADGSLIARLVKEKLEQDSR